MKKKVLYSFLLLSVLFVLTGGCGKESRPKLIMVTNATFPPYEYIHRQQIDGIDPKIVGTIAERLGYELEIHDMNFDSVIAAVQSGKADIAASGITVTEERKKQVNFTVPYITALQVVLVPKNSPVQSVSDLKKCRIGVQHGTTGDLFVTQNICSPERFANGPLAVVALNTGKLDAVVIDSEPAGVFLRRHASLRMLKEPLTGEEYAFAISKKNQKLLTDFNNALSEMRQSGELQQIIDHYRALHEKENNKAGNDPETSWEKFKDALWVNFVKDDRYLYLLHGFTVTLEVTAFAVLLGILIGFAVAVIRCTADQTGKLKLADFFCRIYLTVIRGTPVVVQLLIIYFVIFGAVDVDKVPVAVLAFGINSGAYVAEIIRSGIMSIDKGQLEAGRSLGLSYNQTMYSVIMPQACKNVLPALGNEFIVLLKETSIAGYIALQDLTKAGDVIRSQTYDAFLPLMAVALIYLAVVMFLSNMLQRLEKRLKKNE